MDFSDPPGRPRAESIIPMINVVFLLLIFFLMTAQIAPPEPFEVTPPDAEAGEPAEADLILYVGSEGQMGFRDITGEAAVLAALSELSHANCADPCEKTPLVTIRADAGVPASKVAILLPKLAELGFTEAQIVTVLR